MMFKRIKGFIRRFPGYAMVIMGAELALAAFLLTVVYLDARTLSTLRTSHETKAEAVVASELHSMELTLRDEGLSGDQKRLILYGKAQSAMEALAGTGFSGGLKQRVTEALNGFSLRILEENSSEELLRWNDEIGAVLSLFASADGESMGGSTRSRENSTQSAAVRSVETPKMKLDEIYTPKREVMKAANRLFGVSGVLSEQESLRKGMYLFSCKNAYAVMNAAENYPMEASVSLPQGDAVYTAVECGVFARSFLEEAYPRKIYRRMSVVGERELGDFCEVVFQGWDGETVTVRISKSSGRMIRLSTEGLERK